MSTTALLLSLTLAYAGMLSLCLGMQRHWKQLANPRLPAMLRRIYTPLGGALLGLSGWAATDIWSSAMAAVAWFGMISLTGLALVLLMPYRPRLVLSIPLFGTLLTVLATVFG
ncbi:DUF3325 domain-containing protein [Pseudomonas saudiphocaensis]|uniref:Putative iron uptake protein n=1 Tax=Pseudomonas saudiphocaensis TaxID=1499686 RepID=A0A078LPF8_9PSED|nr:DUF3325 domain-containing protein [Pseudomonas saudiphocaensis]CDZ92939.1 putative iron uptake protein [Pseudomonas saudiphocaensis]